MATKIANLWWLRHLVGLLQGDEQPIDPEDDDVVRAFLRNRLSPLFAILSPKTKAGIEDALRYYLNLNRPALQAVLNDAYELPFVPQDAGRFFSLVWECVFEDKTSEVKADEEWSEVDEQGTARLLFDAHASLNEWQKQFVDRNPTD